MVALLVPSSTASVITALFDRRHLKQGPHRGPRLTKLTIRMRELSRMQPRPVQAANVVITSTGMGRAISNSRQEGSGHLWHDIMTGLSMNLNIGKGVAHFA